MIQNYIKRVVILHGILVGMLIFVIAMNIFTDWICDKVYSGSTIDLLMLKLLRLTGSGTIAEVVVITIDLFLKAALIAVIYPFVKRFVMNNLDLFGIEIDSME